MTLFGFVLGPSSSVDEAGSRSPQAGKVPAAVGSAGGPGSPEQPTTPSNPGGHPPPQANAPAGSAGGGGGGGAPTAPVNATVTVLTPTGQPLEGALVRTLDGRHATTNLDGLASLSGPIAGLFVQADADGFAPSLYFADANSFTVHLRADGVPSAPFNQVGVVLSGQVSGATSAIVGGDVVYVDHGGSLVTQSVLNANGTFSVRVTPQVPHPGRGSLMVLAETAASESLVALSEVQLGGVDQNLGSLTLAALGTSVTYSAVPLPSGLNGRTQAMLKLTPPNQGAALVVRGTEAALGQLPGPPATLPAGWKATLEFEALSQDGQSASMHAREGSPVGGALQFQLLEAPTVADHGASLSWGAVNGAQAYHTEAHLNGGRLAWERLESSPSPVVFADLPANSRRLSVNALASSGGAEALPRLLLGMGRAFRIDRLESATDRRRSTHFVTLP